MARAWGFGFNPQTSLNFIGPTISVNVLPGESVLVFANKALGSTAAGGGTALTLNICYQAAAGAITAADATGVPSLRVPTNTRIIQSLSTELPPSLGLSGTYTVGMCGLTSSVASWNDNGAGSITAVVAFPE